MLLHVKPLLEKHLRELIKKLSFHGPKTYPLVWVIELSLKGKRNADVYTDEWPEFTTVVVDRVRPRLCEECVLLHTTDTNRCKQFLLTNITDWEQKNFGALLPEACTALSDALSEKGIKSKFDGGYAMFCTKQDWKPNADLSLPSGYHESVLKHTDVATVVANWMYSEPGTAEYISFVIDNLSTICVRDDNGALASWLLHLTVGMLGMLHVLEEHRRHGLAKYMVQRLSERLLQNGIKPFVFIHKDNKQSIMLHEKCDYENTGDVFAWFQTSKKDDE